MVDGPSKVSGNLNAAAGAVKETVGSALGNESLQAKGAAQRAEGNTEVEAAKAQGYAQGAGESAKGSVKSTVGSALGNESLQAKGELSKAQGEAQKTANQ